MLSKISKDEPRTKIIAACDTMVIRFQLHIQYNRKHQKFVTKRNVNGKYLLFLNCWLKLTSYKKVLAIFLHQMYMDKFTPTNYRGIPINLNDYPKPKSVPSVPIIGSLKSMRGNKCPFIQFSILSQEYGDIYSIKMGNKNGIVVNNLEIIREVLNENGKYFGGRPDFLRFHALFGGDRNNSLALCDWSTLQQRRRNLARKFCSPRETTSNFSSLNDIGVTEIKSFLTHLDETIEYGTSINLKTYIQQCCANMFMGYMCTKRFDYNNREFQQIVKDFDNIFWEINQGYALDFIPLTQPWYASHLAKIVQWAQRIRYFILKEIVLDRVEAHTNNEVDDDQSDFTRALLEQMGDGIDPNAIIYMLEDFIGGHSAIGNLITMMLAFIVKQPEVGKRIYSEITAITENGEREITLYDMERMPYTMATMNETLRYQSSPIVPHVATENVVISGYGIEAGSIVFINNYMLNRGEDYWDAPDRFDPTRFLETVPMKRKRATDSVDKDSGMDYDGHNQDNNNNNNNNNNDCTNKNDNDNNNNNNNNNKPIINVCPYNKNNDSMNKIDLNSTMIKNDINNNNNSNNNNNNNNDNKPTNVCPFSHLRRNHLEEVQPNEMLNDDDIEYVTRVKKNIPHFLPFSIGKRTCIGQNLVRSYTFLILTNILQKYQITCADPKTIQMNDACVALPTDTFKLILNVR